MIFFKTNRLSGITFNSGNETVIIDSVATHSRLGGFWRKIMYLGSSKAKLTPQNPKQYVNIESLCKQLIKKRVEASGAKLDKKTINNLVKSAKKTYKQEFQNGITLEKVKNLYENIPVSFDGDIYRGPLNNGGLPHGTGQMIYKDGSVYKGTFNAGQKTNGRFVKCTNLKEYKKFNGKKRVLDQTRNDKVVDESKRRYSGRHSTYEDSIRMDKTEVFEGDFENDVLIKGTYTRYNIYHRVEEKATINQGHLQNYNGERRLAPPYENFNEIYIKSENGHFINSKLEGHGTRKYRDIVDRGAFTGNFKAGEINGQGQYQMRIKRYNGNNAQILIEGDRFTEGKKTHLPLLQGKGVETVAENPNKFYLSYKIKSEVLTRYEGEFVNGLKHGKGKLVNQNGDVFIGTWENGFMNGKFKVYDKDNKIIFNGTYFNGVPHGKGQEFNPKTQTMETYEYKFINQNDRSASGYRDRLITKDPLIIDTYSQCGFIRTSTKNPAARKIRDIPT